MAKKSLIGQILTRKGAIQRPILKKNKKILGLISGLMASAFLFTSCASTGVGGDIYEPLPPIYPESSQETVATNNNYLVDNMQGGEYAFTEEELETAYENLPLNFYVNNYYDENYLYADKEDLLVLIEKAMREVDQEYLSIGNKCVFDGDDANIGVYSRFSSYHILAMMEVETSLRLLKIKNENDIYNFNNYEIFSSTSKGVTYYGLGMMNQTTLNYIVEQDRRNTNGFQNYNYIKIDGKNIEITWENINPYLYVQKSQARSQDEIKQALKECIMLNAKCIYIYLNRIVKDNVKGASDVNDFHQNNLDKLETYEELANLNTVQKQLVFAFICYNNGPSDIETAMISGTLFNKNEDGYVYNVNYATNVANSCNKEYKNINIQNLINNNAGLSY